MGTDLSPNIEPTQNTFSLGITTILNDTQQGCKILNRFRPTLEATKDDVSIDHCDPSSEDEESDEEDNPDKEDDMVAEEF
jgi:hypothetical protein